ncbi:pyridoxamine 5'-phosphate oxidase [Halobacteriales archaeon QS_5_70_15]|nr:MAG: pyridoxamine 5'-phosphate oxidase [Halobacteriales archaeon QS_5_70_15]
MVDSVPREAEELLTSEPLTAYLATSREDRPHVAPVWYRYEDGTVEVMTTGRKLENLRANPRVSLAVQKAEAGIPEWTVTLLGTAEVVEEAGANREANRRINRKYGAEPDAWEGNTLVRIDVGSASHRTY